MSVRSNNLRQKLLLRCVVNKLMQKTTLLRQRIVAHKQLTAELLSRQEDIMNVQKSLKPFLFTKTLPEDSSSPTVCIRDLKVKFHFRNLCHQVAAHCAAAGEALHLEVMQYQSGQLALLEDYHLHTKRHARVCDRLTGICKREQMSQQLLEQSEVSERKSYESRMDE